MARLTQLKPRLIRSDLQQGVPTVSSWRSGKSSAERGYGHKWRVARVRHLKLSPLCVYCLANELVVAATVVDHVRPHRGDQALFWDRSNWQSLCATCHSSVKQRQESGGGW